MPVFFIYTGMTFDLQALVQRPVDAGCCCPCSWFCCWSSAALPGLLSAPPGSDAADKRAIVLFCATGLPIIVAVTGIGVDAGDLPAAPRPPWSAPACCRCCCSP